MAATSQKRSGTTDLTVGKPLFQILRFALPLVLGTLFQQLYSFMDTMVVGGVLGTEALAAVGDTGSLNFLINGFCMGICSGFAIPIAQAFGVKDETEMRRYVMHSVYLCAVISVLMGLLTGVFAPQLLRMLNTPEDILPLSVAYIQPVFFAIPVTVLYNMCGGVMRSLGDSKTPVIAITIAALLNIVLDYTFILAFHMAWRVRHGRPSSASSSAASGVCWSFASDLPSSKCSRRISASVRRLSADCWQWAARLACSTPSRRLAL